ncbi:MAG: hypothetical protein ACC742_11580, partial [Thermoanaerobaculales bacterium]
ICILSEDGEVMETSRVRTSRAALNKFFGRREPMRMVLEAGGSSPWVSRLLDEFGHEVVVCSPRRVRLIAESVNLSRKAGQLQWNNAPPSTFPRDERP